MIEILNPGWLCLAVDRGRFGHAHIGVPPSAALDTYALEVLNYLLGNDPASPALEVMGNDFSVKIGVDAVGAVTGAKVAAFLDEKPVRGWEAFPVPAGSILRIRQTLEGFRYYVGFSGLLGLDNVMGSYTTNLECAFGGLKGRPLVKSDRILLKDPRPSVPALPLPEDLVPPMNHPHLFRITRGPERGYFTGKSLGRLFEKTDASWYTVSSKSNRTGIRLEGEPLVFKKDAERSIISEGIVPGTIQVPGDGHPIVTMYERTIGGYARLGIIAKADLPRLAHLKPKDRVAFEEVSIEEAEGLWEKGSFRRFKRLTEGR